MSLRTPLYEQHVALGARMVEFGGWDMPVQYSSILKEHAAVREAAGLFDVSHMGVYELHGPQALEAAEYLVPNQVSRLSPGRGLYTQLCTPEGGTVDDLLIFYLSENRYWLIVNAGNREGDWNWIQQHSERFDAKLIKHADDTGILALQGPQARAILSSVLELPADLKLFDIVQAQFQGQDFWLSCSGYTGEDGFELYVPHSLLPELWSQLLAQGQDQGLQAVGLGARDTLRLEAAMPLYGHELTPEISPLEAGLGWSVKLQKESDFLGKSALSQQKATGLQRRRIGFTMPDSRRAPREGYPLMKDEQQIGVVTSGSLSPTLGYPIGMGYIDAPWCDDPELVDFEVDIRGKRFSAHKQKLPFYRRNV